MSLKAPCTYKVVIRHNIVVAIEMTPLDEGENRPDDDPLELSSRLSRNNVSNGCLDGEYVLADAEAARYFARLSLDFLKRTIEKSMESLDASAFSGTGWNNPYLPG